MTDSSDNKSENTPAISQSKFFIGQLVSHKLFSYRGVVADVDACFQGSEQWYKQIAKTNPPKDKPWYRVLVHDADHETYVAERNLSADTSLSAVNHPLVDIVFNTFADGRYWGECHD